MESLENASIRVGLIVVVGPGLIVGVSIVLLSFMAGVLTLTLLAQFKIMANLWVRVISGAGAGVTAAWWARGVSPFLSYLEAAVDGSLGIAGYAFLVSLNVLIVTWAIQLWRLKGVLME